MKHLKYITWMLLVVLCAACEQMQLPDTDVIIEREKATDLTANSAVIEVEFYPTDATIKTVEVYYTEGLHYSKLMHKEMLRVSGLTYRAELTNLNSNTKYQVYYLLKNAFSTLEVNDDFSFRTAKNNKPSNVIDTVYHIDFRQTIGAWTVRNYMLPEGMGYVWQKTDKYGMKASAFLGSNHASEAWLISPPLNLTSNTTAYLTFDQTYKYGDVSQLSVKITKNGLDWTTLEVPTWPDGTSWDFINSGEIDITKYISANTQIAYAYTSSTDGAPTWEIRDVLIKGNGTRIEEPATSVTVPTVVTSAVTQIAETTAVAGGNVKSDGGASVTERGVVYSTSANPTTASNKVTSGSGTGAFVCNLTDLQPNTTYYVCAYAKNDFGIAYGDEVSFTTKEEVIATPEYVDLGLSVKWATFNVGATKPEEYGDYFAWGETEPKDSYSWSTYKWCNGSETTLTKYCTSSSYGTVDNKKTLELSDDAAYANWGGEWRMPTKAEQDELRINCTWIWTIQNGVNGYRVTSKKNGMSIFLPATGYYEDSSPYGDGSDGYYWSGSLGTGYPDNTCGLSFNSVQVNRGYGGDRYCGHSVRPVYGPQVTVPTVTTSTVTQITETTAMAGGNVTSDGGASVTERGVVYSTSANPTTASNKVTSGSGTGAFVCNLTDLQPNTTYYVRAYAINKKGTAYGNQVVFTTLEAPIENGHEYVDMGLSVKWATCNVGATKPEEYGDYFAWGETQPKSTYNWSTYKWCNGSYDMLTKYNTNSSYGTVDNKTQLELSDDAARANWGGSWRMPTDAELTELRENCTWTWTTQNGVYGYKVTSKKSGYTNKSIFLPAAGYRSSSGLYNAGSYGGYWSSSLYTDYPSRACVLYFYSGSVNWGSDYRDVGQSVRPVCP